MHLLFLEDDEALAFVTRRALEKRGYRVRWFADVTSVRQQLPQLPVDCALLDLKVGQETSLSLVTEIRAQHPQAPIVLLTGYGSIATAVQAMKRGASDYLTKPCSAARIIAALQSQASPEPEAEIPEVTSPSLKRVEWETIQRALDENEGNISATARQLKMHRRTLQRKLQKRPRR